MSTLPPTSEDWSGYEVDRDAKYAHSVFFGKDRCQAKGLFKDNVIQRVTDLRFMPKKPFAYYLLSLKDALIENQFDRNQSADAASCFLEIVAFKLKNNPDYLYPVLSEVIDFCRFLADSQEAFNADKDVYGDFGELLSDILERKGSDPAGLPPT